MIALVPARSGSKGLPGKNIKKLAGKPLLAYSIEAALAAKGINEVIISTDHEEIAEVALAFGAKCPFLRPAHLASDSAKAIDNYQYTIDRLNREFGYDIDAFMVLQPTSPLRSSADIEGAIQLFTQKRADSVLSFVEEAHPIIWHKYLDKEGRFEDIFTEDEKKNRQDYRKSYYPNGAIYIFSVDLIMRNRYFSENSFAYVMSRRESVDIDTQEDFDYAEFLLGKCYK